jgi:sugar/nucleoside kinase (ribokinase family)
MLHLLKRMRPKYDIISIGDATIDTFLFIHDIEIKNIKGQKKALINWGDKLPVDELYRTVAGNAANNAVGSSRLGLKTAFYTVLAHDAGGREIVHKMQKEKVGTEYIVIDDKHGTNASTVISFEGERTILVYHEHRSYHLPKFSAAKWLYLTSMGDGFEKIYKDLAHYIDLYKVKVGFNPGTFQLRKGVAANREILKRTEVLSLNKEEAISWVGESNDPEELCQKLMQFGPKAITLTDGRRGAYSFSSEGFYYIPEFPGPRIEATGAGDAFTTAYIAALALGKTHKEALRWGPVNAGSVVLKIGPQEGLLTKSEIEEKLLKNKSFQSVPITSEKMKQQIMKMVAKKKD